MYGADGEIQAQIKFEKTPEGLVTKRTDVDGNGVINSIITTEYTDFNAEKTISRFNGDGTLKGYDEYEYDAKQNLTKVSTYNAEGELKRYITYVMDENGTITEYEYDAAGNLVSTN